ncbi:MAG: DNA-3-methyladenine glycosylase I [Myxococcales bacterium]|nr:DNA-3-methyladenine glycosylase I [Myxococcales bacterium]
MAEADDGLVRGDDGVVRCWWGASHPDYLPYHDDEWGRPVADDRRLFEKICLEGFQSGLSWLTILRKRENFRRAFYDFDIDRVARMGSDDVERLLTDTGIVRHRKKIEATLTNARAAQEVIASHGSLAAYFWGFEPPASARPDRFDKATLVSLGKTEGSIALSADLKRRGWVFVGPTTAYAFMQAMGLVNDHLEGCHARPARLADREAFQPPSRPASA